MKEQEEEEEAPKGSRRRPGVVGPCPVGLVGRPAHYVDPSPPAEEVRWQLGDDDEGAISSSGALASPSDKPQIPPKPGWLSGRPVPRQVVQLRDEELDELSDSVSELSDSSVFNDDVGPSVIKLHRQVLSRSVSMDAGLVSGRRRAKASSPLRISSSCSSPDTPPSSSSCPVPIPGQPISKSPSERVRALGAIRSISIDEGLSMCHHSVQQLKVGCLIPLLTQAILSLLLLIIFSFFDEFSTQSC